MKNIRIGWLVAMLFTAGLCWSGIALAGPARTDLQSFRQPSGESFTGRLQGDERLHWALTAGDEAIVKDAKGYWNYASLDSKAMKPSGRRVGIDAKPASPKTERDVREWVKSHPEARGDNIGGSATGRTAEAEVGFSAEGPEGHASLSPAAPLLFGTDGQRTTGTQQTLVLLVSFTNIAIQYSDSQWNKTFFSTTDRSVKGYYNEVSQGRMSLVPATESSGTANDGIVKVTINHAHTSGAQLVAEALVAADPYVNFAGYDSNGDGYIQNDELRIVTILAGYEQSYDGGAQMPSVWGHYASLADSESPLIDGKKAVVGIYGGGYTQQGERQGDHQATIGIFAHELGHTLGLPDLYDTDGSSDGIGNHSLMSYGSWGTLPGEYSGSTPVHLDAWSKLKLGFADAVQARSNVSTAYILKSSGTGAYNIVKIPTLNPDQYFLLENRQLEGYNRSLNAHGGIAVWHIDESRSYNWDDGRRLVDLEKATAENPYYYAGNRTEFSPTTTPGSNIYGYPNSYTGITASMPQASSATMTAYIFGDYEAPAAVTGLQSLYATLHNTGLTWNASLAPDFEAYVIYQDGVLFNRLTARTAKVWFPNVVAGPYAYTVRAVDRAGNESADSNPVVVTPDSTERVIVYYKRGFAAPVIHYKIHYGDPNEPWTDAPLVPSEYPGYSKIEIPTGTERINVVASFHDGNGHWDDNDGRYYPFYSGVNTFEAGQLKEDFPAPPPAAPDTAAPSVPQNVTAVALSSSSVTVSWSAAIDNVAVAGYEVYRGGTLVGTATGTSYTDTGLAAATTYSYTVKTKDAAGNLSAFSAAASATTSAGNNVTIYYKQGFTAPYIHYRPVGGTWTTAPGVAMPASEVSGYNKITINIGTATQLEACFNNGSGTWDSNNSQNYLFGVGTWTYTPTGNIAAGVPASGDSQAPTVPGSVSATATSATTVNVTWTASTDNVGVTAYDIYRGGAKIGSAAGNATSYTDSTAAAGTTYSYTVKALDTAGNASAASAAATVTTPAGSGSVTIYYKNTAYTNAYIHYKLDNSTTWTTSPGVQMTASTTYPGYKSITIPLNGAAGLTAAFNNGSGTWDNNGGTNYHFDSGVWTLVGGTKTAGEPQADSVTFRVTVPSNTPASGPVYLSGSFNSWNAADPAYKLTKGTDGVYSITLSLTPGTAYTYKLTRGTWASVETTSSGADIANRTLTPSGGAQTVNVTVARWKDL
ncbi:carbohydrate binding domain-containing protein [Cohnella sp. GbtcB17]|uniref:carbohydrate binding domain-containing protein n=1 Tax=Cohnella sp. GbtcB17 TaxID=2824762 RepID=UPI001C2F4D1E